MEPTSPNQTPETPPADVNINTMSAQERINFVLEVRRRVQVGETVPDEDIRNAVQVIRLSRADAAKTRKGKKAPVRQLTIADF